METFCLKNTTINIGMIEKSPIYCHYAFKNIHVNVDGTTRPCCEYNKIDTEYNLKKNSIEEVFNQPNFAKVREDLSRGIEHKNCDICFKREKSGKKSPRQLANKANGMNNNEPEISSMTLALSNLCNLACRTCGPTYSSNWFNEYYELYWKQQNFTRAEKLIEYKNNRSIDDSVILSKFNKNNLKNLNEIKFFGGEPLLDSSMWQICKVLVDLNLAENIVLHYNTNCTVIPTNEQQAIWQKFKKVFLNLSIDGTEKHFEYLRYGANWPEVESNIKKFIDIKNKLKNIQLTQILTISSINIFDIDKTINFYIKHFSNDINLYTNNVSFPSYFSFSSIPDSVKDQISKKLIDLSKLSKNFDYVSNIRSLNNFLKKTAFNKVQLKLMLEKIEKHDIFRQQDFKIYFSDWAKILYKEVEEID